MFTLTSLAKVAVLASCIFNFVSAETQQQNAADFFDLGAEAQHVFSSNNLNNAVDAVKDILHKGSELFTTFSHPDFSDYAIRYKHPTLCDPTVQQISGYLDAGRDKHFFFWFFESRDRPESDPVILWLNGGPGCSSFTGLFMELGPCKVTDDGTDTYLHEYSWTDKANVIFLDQPLNVGYSHGDDAPWTTKTAAQDVYAFLQLFFTKFPKYANLDLHVAGESYGGHYVPAIGSVINEKNKALSADSDNRINLNSIMIGNGLTDPLTQFGFFAEMACNNTYAPVLDQSTCDKMNEQLPTCQQLIKNCYKYQNPLACIPASLKCNNDQVNPYMKAGLNPYDVREKCNGHELCYDILDAVEAYLNIPEVIQELGGEVKKFENCNENVGFKFQLSGDWMLPFVDQVTGLLEDDIRVLVYNGDADFVCNWFGGKAWATKLQWSGHQEFSQANDTEWYSDRLFGKQAGELRQTADGRLAFLRVFGGGHMVPYDQPESALDMVQQWLSGSLD